MKKFAQGLKIFAIIMLILMFGVACLSGGAFLGIKYLLKPMTPKNTKVNIPWGSSTKAVALQLERKGTIENYIPFLVFLKISKWDRDIKAGKYEIPKGSSIIDIALQLKQGRGRLRLITLPEGLTIVQIAHHLKSKGVIKDVSKFIETTKEGYKVDGKVVKNLEGYLLPDTYDIPSYYTDKDIVKMMVDAFNEKVVPLYKKHKNDLPVKLSLAQVVTLASMVEREAQIPKERPIIAMVYYNRLKKGMMLQCDATVRYALKKYKGVLTYKDLKCKSPYNTYTHKGLPPAPISNPGIASIKSVLNPKKSDYLFYVRNDKKNDGSHIFSKTYKEHIKAIRKYQR